MRAVLLLPFLLAASASAQPLQITEVDVPATPRATEGALVTIPLRVTVRNTGRNDRVAYATARLGSGAETPRVTSSSRLAPDATTTLSIPLPVDLRSGAVADPLTADVLVYTNATTVADRRTVTLRVDREEPPTGTPPDPTPGSGRITLQVPPAARLGQRPEIVAPVGNVADRFPPSIGLITAGVLQVGRPASEVMTPLPNTSQESHRIVGLRIVAMVQNLGALRRTGSFRVHYDADLAGRRIQGTQILAPYVGGGSVSPIVIALGEFPDPTACRQAAPPGSPQIPDIGGIRAQAETACTLALLEEERTRTWPFQLHSGDAFRITLRLEAENDASPADDRLTLEGTVGTNLELVLQAPRVESR